MSDRTSVIIHLRAMSWALNLTRLNVLLLIATTVLVSVDQGRDLLLSMAQDARPGDYLSLLGGTLIWATSIWLWARVMLDIEFPDAPVSPHQLRFWRKWLPRLLGLLAFISVTVNLGLALGHASLLVILLTIEGVAFTVFVWKRRAIGRRLATRLRPGEAETSLFWAEEIDGEKQRPLLPDLASALRGLRGRIAMATLILGLLLLAWGLSWPLSLGQSIDTLLLLMLWGAGLLPVGSVFTYWGNKRGVPVVLPLAALVLLSSCFNDNHAIRTLEHGDGGIPRPGLVEAIEAWEAANCDNAGCAPFTLVATAGGGIRAAFWTGTVLGDLHERFGQQSGADRPAQPDGRAPGFTDRLFAVSGVSGGSVGATVYRSVAANTPPGQPLLDTVQNILGEDYLGPASAGLLYPDLVQRFVPWAAFEDRASVFERGLEAGFRKYQPHGPVQLEDSFVDNALFLGRPWPALFLNSTWSDNGRRVVGATLDTRTLSPDAPAYRDQVPPLLFKDLLGSMQADMRLSTAAHNSARFPIVSPAGGWAPKDMPDDCDRCADIRWQRLQDGGLFENFGAETALEILGIAQRVLGERFHPLVIMISSDPTLPENIAAFDWQAPVSFGYEVRSTLHTFSTSRVGRGAEAASRLRHWTEQHQATFAHFLMCSEDGAREPPLGWVLSDDAQRRIDSFLDDANTDACPTSNRAARAAVLAALRKRR